LHFATKGVILTIIPKPVSVKGDFMSTTIIDIAQQLNLSKSTVSKALNGYSDISAETRELVLRKAAELGYQPSSAALNLSRGRTDKIGLFLNTSINYVIDYLSGIISGAVRQANQLGKHLVLYTITDNDPAYLLQICRGREIDGVILFSTHYDSDLTSTMLRDNFPFVVMGRRILDERISYVVPDYYDGVYRSTQYLMNQGHRRIGFMTRPELETANDEHLNGYLDALADAGLAVDDDLIVETRLEPNSGVEPTRKLLALPNRPTAILAFHDLLAVDAIRVIHEHGLHVPNDIAVMGFDGLSAGLISSPRISTVQQPFEQIGRRVIEIVNMQIENQETSPIQETVPVELVIREST